MENNKLITYSSKIQKIMLLIVWDEFSNSKFKKTRRLYEGC